MDVTCRLERLLGIHFHTPEAREGQGCVERGPVISHATHTSMSCYGWRFRYVFCCTGHPSASSSTSRCGTAMQVTHGMVGMGHTENHNAKFGLWHAI